MSLLALFFLLGGYSSTSAVECIYCFCNQRLYAENQLEQCQQQCRPGLGCFTGICQNINVPGTNPNPEQNENQRGAFPNLQCYSVVEQPCDPQTSCPASRYNCIANAIGVTDRWIWQEVDGYGDRDGVVEITDFDDFFGYAGFRPVENCNLDDGREKIALYGRRIFYDGNSVVVPTHAARQLPTGLFESKEGSYKKIWHAAQDMAGGGLYGELIKCYER